MTSNLPVIPAPLDAPSDDGFESIFDPPETLRQMTAQELAEAKPGDVFAFYHQQIPWLRPFWEKGRLPERDSERTAWIGATHCGGNWTPISEGWLPADSTRLWLSLERLLPLVLDPTVEEIWVQRLINPPVGITPIPGYVDVLTDGLMGVRVHPELRMPESSVTSAFQTILSKGGKKLYGMKSPEGTPIVESPLEAPGFRLAGGIPPLSIAPFLAIRIPAREKPNIFHLSGARAFPPKYDQDLIAPGVPLRIPSFDPIEEARKLIDEGGYQGPVMFPLEALEYIRCVFLAGWNMAFSGATSSAKTTALNAALNLMPPQWRFVTMEHNVFELKLSHVNWLPLLSSDNLVGKDGKPILTPERVLQLVLRLSPRPIPVGEIRGPEGLGWVRGTTTGHEASPTSGHSGGPDEFIQRLTTDMIMPPTGMPLNEARNLACKAANVIVQLAREEILDGDKVVSRRRCVSIHEVRVEGSFISGDQKASLVPVFETKEIKGVPTLTYVGEGKCGLWPLMRSRYMHNRLPKWVEKA